MEGGEVMVPRGGLTKFSRRKNLSCPTPRDSPIESQCVFLRLSHRFLVHFKHESNVRFTPKSGHCSGLIDYFIGAAEQRRRHGKAEHSGGVRIDDQLELVQLNNWQFRRLGALKDAANIATGLAM